MSDDLDLTTVEYHNSPDISGWPATAQITRLEFRPTGVHVEHTKNAGPDRWPDFWPGPGWDQGGEGLQYTLWIFLKIGGRWHGSGCIEYWRTCQENGGPPEEFAAHWYYAADRWAPMTGYQPQPGERVGFLVAAGDQRNNGRGSVNERSSVYVMPFPRSGDVWTPPAATVPDVPDVPATPEAPGTPSVPVPSPDRLVAILEQGVVVLQQLSDTCVRLEQTVATKEDLRALRQEIITLGKPLAEALAGASPNTALTALTRLWDRR